MRRLYAPNPSGSLWKIIFPAVALLCTANLVAQKPSSPKYDPHTEMKMKGPVAEVKLPPKGSEKEAVHVLVKNGTDIVDVYLCPGSFLKDMGVSRCHLIQHRTE